MRIALFLFALLAALNLPAAELRQPTPDVHALVGVRIVTAPGQVIESGSVIVRDGIIEAVGADASVPPDARVHEFPREDGQDPMVVYPGLIEPYLPIEFPEPEDDAVPPGRHALVQPDRRITASDWPEERIGELRQAGFTTALMAGDIGLLRGHGVITNTGDAGLGVNRLSSQFGQFVSFADRAEGRSFPNSLMGAVALVRQTMDDARWQAQARAAMQRNPAQSRPEWLEGLDDLRPALAGETPMVFESQDLLDTLRILEFIPPGDIDLAIVGHGAEYQRLDALAERPVRHILPLNFPEAPDIEQGQERDVSLEALRHWHQAPENPARILEAGIPMMVTSHGLSAPGQVYARLAVAIERGLDPDAALAAVTTEPARWLGLEDRAGRIRPGMMANLIVVEGDLLTENPAITEVWVDGQRHVLASLEPPAVDPAGTWDLVLGLGGMGDVEATLALEGAPTSMTGTLSVMGNDSPLNEVRVSGERVIATIDGGRFGGSGTISIRLDIDGERARGSGSGPFGEFSVRGQRSARPDDEEAI
ncbi:amidohydrolase family protein [Wenzhouxiangella limi]|uniref:Amidohydrolase family protein n=1 Tax=Wenzhouxiangella limi TaxID=2707351 RepID=A0A845V2G7_9GAMM|nr:amidohydrolase family protein [Wenzhouxiangella limi]NDY95446.1 amidohydrolase family protein [Wenzhouxiangella limi]